MKYEDAYGNIFEVKEGRSWGVVIHIENKCSQMEIGREYTIQAEYMKLLRLYNKDNDAN